MEYRCVPNAKVVMGEFHTMVDQNPPQGLKKGGERRANTTSKRVTSTNISMCNGNLMLTNLKYSFFLIIVMWGFNKVKDPGAKERWSNIRRYLKKKKKGSNVV